MKVLLNVEILNSFNLELQLKDTESVIKSKLIELLIQLNGFKFVTTLVLVFKKIESKDKTKYDNFHLSSKSEIIINGSDIDNVFQSIFTTVMENIRKSLGEGSGWIIDSVPDHAISISKYNIQNNDDNVCFNWCLVRYSNPAEHNPRRIIKSNKDFAKRFDFKDIKFPFNL